MPALFVCPPLLRVYEGARHELVNETNRDEVIDEIARFVSRASS